MEEAVESGPSPFPKRLRSWAADALSVTHVAIMLLFVVGWALPWREALAAVMVAALVVQAGWWLFGDVCLLTILEKRLRGLDALDTAGLDTDARLPPNFIADLASGVLRRPVPRRGVDLVARAVMWGAFTIAALRLLLNV